MENHEAYLKALYIANRKIIIRKLKRQQISEHDAEDLYQDAMIVLSKKLVESGLFQQKISRKYIWEIVRRLNANKRRKKDEKIIPPEDLMNNSLSSETPESYLLKKEQKEQLLSLIMKLEDKCREVLTLYLKNFSAESIASQMGWRKAQSAMNMLSKCRRNLKKLFNHA